MFNPLGTPFQTELGTPNDWPFLGACQFFPSGPTSLPVKESAAGAVPARPPPPSPVTCPQAPRHRNDLLPRLARNRSPCPVEEGAGTTGGGFRFETQSTIHKKVKLPQDPGEARRGVPWYLLRSVLKALSWLCILAGESLGMACRRFLDMTARKIR